MTDGPLGYHAAEADWNIALAGRQMQYKDWASLTLGEQARYAAKECETCGAIFSSKIKENEIPFSVRLPPSLALHGLTSDDAARLERYMHRKLEEQIVAILRFREFSKGQSHE